MVKKAEGGWRLCIDFRKLNAVTDPDPFPIPRIDDLLDKVGKAHFLTKLDMAKGYYQVPCDEESIPMTGFVTPFGFSVGGICRLVCVMLLQLLVVWLLN